MSPKSDSVERVIRHVSRQLESGYSGKIIIECKEGNVRRVYEERTLFMVDLPTTTPTTGQPIQGSQRARGRGTGPKSAP